MYKPWTFLNICTVDSCFQTGWFGFESGGWVDSKKLQTISTATCQWVELRYHPRGTWVFFSQTPLTAQESRCTRITRNGRGIDGQRFLWHILNAFPPTLSCCQNCMDLPANRFPQAIGPQNTNCQGKAKRENENLWFHCICCQPYSVWEKAILGRDGHCHGYVDSQMISVLWSFGQKLCCHKISLCLACCFVGVLCKLLSLRINEFAIKKLAEGSFKL